MTDVVEMKLRDALNYLIRMLDQVGTLKERVELFYEFMSRHNGTCTTLRSGKLVIVSIEMFGISAIGSGKSVFAADQSTILNWLLFAELGSRSHG